MVRKFEVVRLAAGQTYGERSSPNGRSQIVNNYPLCVDGVSVCAHTHQTNTLATTTLGTAINRVYAPKVASSSNEHKTHNIKLCGELTKTK